MAGIVGALRVTAATAVLVVGTVSPAATLQLVDGRVLRGKLGETGGVAEDPLAPGISAGEIRTTPILVVEDGLRRTYLHKTAVREVLDDRDEPPVRIRVWQNEAKRGASLGTIGAPSRVTPFDEFGRRVIELPTNHGAIAVVQGITEVNPVYTRVEGLRAEPQTFLWDMRLATSSLSRETLARVLSRAVPRDNFDQRMQVVRLYLQSERYRDAAEELEAIRDDFAASAADSGADIEDNLRRLRELAARTLLDEVELRQGAGQHSLARALLERFPVEGVAGDTLQRVRELLDRDDEARRAVVEVVERLRQTAAGLDEPAARRVAERVVEEIAQRVGPATLDRLAAFRQLAQGGALGADELAAVAISGWLLGSNSAVDSLPTALSLLRIRDSVRAYLATADAEAREAAYLAIRDADGAEVPRLAELIARMEPPLPLRDPRAEAPPPDNSEPGAQAPGAQPAATPPANENDAPGFYERTIRVGERDVRWVVQLPPEYDPLRPCPTILALPDLGSTAETQVDFWAGSSRPGVGRVGQATRRGYAVVAVEWSARGQLSYGYTPQEHAAILASLRDALRRVAIDTDRVYLTGHGAGGDAAWDLALAHPEHWAGVLPFLGVADRYCAWYGKNAEFVPWRVVMGELDGDKLARSARELDRYLRPRYDATVVEYRGRGYDPLSDDLQLAFDWMGRRGRGAPPEEFECVTMRPGDDYFWWVEAEGLPAKSLVPPAKWPPARGVRAASLRARRFSGNKLGVYGGAAKVTVWLSPDVVDFDQPLEVEYNGKRLVPRGERVTPDLRTLLEDVRARGDRKRPWWASVRGP